MSHQQERPIPSNHDALGAMRWPFVVAAILSFVAIADLPYAYYQLLRWIVCGAAVMAAMRAHAAGRVIAPWLLALIAFIFNPLVRFHFSKDMWAVWNVAAGITFLVASSLGGGRASGRNANCKRTAGVRSFDEVGLDSEERPTPSDKVSQIFTTHTPISFPSEFSTEQTLVDQHPGTTATDDHLFDSLDVNSPDSWLESSVMGNSLAMALLGDALCWGGYSPQGISRDILRGYSLLAESASLQDPLGTYLLSRAQRLIGKCRTAPEIADATELQSKTLGFPHDLLPMGPVWLVAEACAYRDGRIVEMDLSRQFLLIQECLESGYTDAWTIYAYCLIWGQGVERDLREGIRWLTRAAESMNAEAMTTLANCYRDGTGVHMDQPMAIDWYTRAAALEQDEAMNALGSCARKGIGRKRNFKEAVYHYRAAAENQNASGCYNLGFCLENGVGVSRNRNEALLWYSKAAALGNLNAKESLRRLGKPQIQ